MNRLRYILHGEWRKSSWPLHQLVTGLIHPGRRYYKIPKFKWDGE